MSTNRAQQRIAERLDGVSDKFIQDATLFGISHAIEEFHLEDIPFANVYDYAQSQTDTKLLAVRGTLHSPAEGDTKYMEDFLSVVLMRFSNYEKRIAELEAENEQLRQAISYHRSHPLANTHKMMAEITKGKGK